MEEGDSVTLSLPRFHTGVGNLASDDVHILPSLKWRGEWTEGAQGLHCIPCTKSRVLILLNLKGVYNVNEPYSDSLIILTVKDGHSFVSGESVSLTIGEATGLKLHCGIGPLERKHKLSSIASGGTVVIAETPFDTVVEVGGGCFQDCRYHHQSAYVP